MSVNNEATSRITVPHLPTHDGVGADAAGVELVVDDGHGGAPFARREDLDLRLDLPDGVQVDLAVLGRREEAAVLGWNGFHCEAFSLENMRRKVKRERSHAQQSHVD